MLKLKSSSVKEEEIELEGVKKSKMQWLLSYKEGMPTFTIRKFRIEPDGEIPQHKHNWEHGIYILDGEGIISEGGLNEFASPGDAFFILADVPHGYSNPNNNDFVFLCMIPNKGDTRKFRYYTHEDLKKEGKIACKNCLYVTGKTNEGCTMAYAVNLQPEDCYWTFGGRIIGCKHGDRIDERIE